MSEIIEILDEIRRLDTIIEKVSSRGNWIGSINEIGDICESEDSLLAKVNNARDRFDTYVLELVSRRLK